MTDTVESGRKRDLRWTIGLPLGPALFLLIALPPWPGGLEGPARYALAITAWMAVWWITEAIHLSATALLPIVLFPVCGVLPAGEVTLSYGHPIVFLFLGGFALAASIEKWGLHRRIALGIVLRVGLAPRRLVLGFMLATGFLSMWISNTATALMMTPIGLAVVGHIPQLAPRRGEAIDPDPGSSPFATSLMLGIAYGASIGGLATIIGSPPNAIFVGYVETAFGETVTFVEWMLYALPVAVGGLFAAWAYLTYVAHPPEFADLAKAGSVIRRSYRALGPFSHAERRVALVFVAVAGLWIGRGLLDPWLDALGVTGITDTTIALIGTLALFLVPAGRDQSGGLLEWEDLENIPWGILILFGGGLTVARGLEASGATLWLASQLAKLEGASPLLLVVAVTTLTIFLTEVTSNTSTATILMPVMASVAAGMGVHPFPLMAAAATSASCAFMLPVATPPNAVVFSSGHVPITRMVRAGFWLNIAFIVIISAAVYGWLPRVWSALR